MRCSSQGDYILFFDPLRDIRVQSSPVDARNYSRGIFISYTFDALSLYNAILIYAEIASLHVIVSDAFSFLFLCKHGLRCLCTRFATLDIEGASDNRQGVSFAYFAQTLSFGAVTNVSEKKSLLVNVTHQVSGCHPHLHGLSRRRT